MFVILLIKASSPDELALLNFAKLIGFQYLGTDEDNNMMIQFEGSIKKYKLLYLLEFTSAR